MSEKKLVVLFSIALLAVAVVWFVADRKFNQKPPEPEMNFAFNDDKPIGGDDDEGMLKLGDPLPALNGKWILPDGKDGPAPELAGKVVIVDVWSTFCMPCVASIPANNGFAKAYESKGVVFIGVSPETRAALLDFKSKKEIAYPLLATSEETLKVFKIELFPSMFMFGKDGKLIWQGSHVLNKQNKLQSAFSKALKAALSP